MLDKICENGYLFYHQDLEALALTIEWLQPFHKNKEIKLPEAVPAKFQWLADIFHMLQQGQANEMLEFLELLTVKEHEEFSLENYEEVIRELSEEQFWGIFFGSLNMDEIKAALNTEEGAIALYEKHKENFGNYLTLRTVLHSREELIRDYFQLAYFFRDYQQEKALMQFQKRVESERELLMTELSHKDTFDYSEEMMGKNCFNRGPYKIFYFVPLMNYGFLFCRIFDQNQHLLYDVKRLRERQANVPVQLKALTDPTRYRILLLLKKEKHLTGIEIAQKLKLAPSTVSHHMTILKENGLVFEEPTGATKYYSLAQRTIQNCIKQLQDAFLIETK